MQLISPRSNAHLTTSLLRKEALVLFSDVLTQCSGRVWTGVPDADDFVRRESWPHDQSTLLWSIDDYAEKRLKPAVKRLHAQFVADVRDATAIMFGRPPYCEADSEPCGSETYKGVRLALWCDDRAGYIQIAYSTAGASKVRNDTDRRRSLSRLRSLSDAYRETAGA